MKTIGSLLKYLLILVAVLLAAAYVLPRKFQVTRSVQVKAPPAAIFDRLNTLQGFNEFSPWYEKDPQAHYAWSGAERGVGARMTWDSKKSDVGKGSQEIIVSEPYRRVVTRLEFGAGGQNDATWLIEPVDGGAKVSWTLNTDAGMNPIVRWFGLFMDGMVGPDFVRGLEKLKVASESSAATSASLPAKVQLLDVASMDIAFVATRAEITPDQSKISAELGRAYGVIGAFIAANKLQMSGPPIAITRKHDSRNWVFDAAIPLAGTPEVLNSAGKTTGEVRIGKSYAGKSLMATHLGPYTTLEQTYGLLEAYMTENKLTSADAPWELYVSDPGNTPQEKLVTNIYWPVKTP